MKTLKIYSFFLLICVLSTIVLKARPQGRADQPRHALPKEEILRPQKLNLKPFALEQLLDDVGWHGTRSSQTAAGAVVDSVTTLSFFLTSKQVTWTKQGWEYAVAKPGTYTVTANKIVIQFSYFPYTHYLEGTYDPTTKKITGTFREERAAIRNAPPAYKVGTTSGVFELIQK